MFVFCFFSVLRRQSVDPEQDTVLISFVGGTEVALARSCLPGPALIARFLRIPFVVVVLLLLITCLSRRVNLLSNSHTVAFNTSPLILFFLLFCFKSR